MTILSDSYNGWTNYATWRVNLEIFDGIDPRDMGWLREDAPCLAESLKEYANEMLEMDAKDGLALDYARAFIADVDWYEIADAMIDVYADADECA